MFDASLHPKVKEECEKRGALATASVSFTKAGMKLLCFSIEMDVTELVSALRPPGRPTWSRMCENDKVYYCLVGRTQQF